MTRLGQHTATVHLLDDDARSLCGATLEPDEETVTLGEWRGAQVPARLGARVCRDCASEATHEHATTPDVSP